MADSRQTTGVRCVVVTPEATVLDTQARFVAVPLYDGERGVGRGHAAFIGRLGAGEVRIVGEQGKGEATTRTFVEGGFVEVGHDVVTVITQRAIPASAIDAAAARADLERVNAEKAVGAEAIAAKMAAQQAARAVVRTVTRGR